MRDVRGVVDIIVSMENREAFITFNTGVTSSDDIAKAVDNIGDKFSARLVSEVCRFNIEGMESKACRRNVHEIVSKVTGVYQCDVSLEKMQAMVEFDPDTWRYDQLMRAINSTNSKYKASIPDDCVISITNNETTDKVKTKAKEECCLNILGMTCSSCVCLIESNLKKINGISSVSVSLSLQQGRIRYDRNVVEREDIVAAISSLGFRAEVTDTEDGTLVTNHEEDIKKWRNSFLISLIFGVPSSMHDCYDSLHDQDVQRGSSTFAGLLSSTRTVLGEHSSLPSIHPSCVHRRKTFLLPSLGSLETRQSEHGCVGSPCNINIVPLQLCSSYGLYGYDGGYQSSHFL